HLALIVEIGRRGRSIEKHGLHERLVERDVARVVQQLVEIARVTKRREAKDRRQAATRVGAFAIGDLLPDRQARREMRVHAARALGRARRKAQDPAVVEELPLRLQRIEARLLDACRVDRRGGACGRGAHARKWSHIASTRMAYAAARRSSAITPQPFFQCRSSARIGGGFTMSKMRKSTKPAIMPRRLGPVKSSTSRN